MSPSPPHDPAAASPLIAAYFERRPNLVRFFAARTGSLAQAEDLAQELYLKLAGQPADIDARAPVALLYRIATNLMLDSVRGAQRSQARETSWRAESGAFLGAEEVTPDAAADEAMITRERLRQLAAAVVDLPPQMQKAFRLHKLEGRSQAETAQVMGVSVKAIEKHISAAIQALAKRMQG